MNFHNNRKLKVFKAKILTNEISNAAMNPKNYKDLVKLNYNYSYNISGNQITINAMFYRTDSEPFSIIPFSGTINYNKATGGSQSYTH